MLQALGNVLDLPGSMIRDTLTLRNPLDQLLSPFSSDNRMSGEQMIEAYGGGKGHDVLGALLSAGLDPMTYIGGGLTYLGGRKLYRAGKAAHAALEAEIAGHAAARAAAAAARTSQNPFAKAVDFVDGLNKAGVTKHGQRMNMEKQIVNAQEGFRAGIERAAADRAARTVDADSFSIAQDLPRLGFSGGAQAPVGPLKSAYDRAKEALLKSRQAADSLGDFRYAVSDWTLND